MSAKDKSTSDAKVMTNVELQEGLTVRLRNLDKPEANLNEAKTYFSGAGKLLGAVKRDMEGAERTGVPYRPHTKRFLGLDSDEG